MRPTEKALSTPRISTPGVEASDPTFSGDSALYAMTSRSALYTFYTPGAGYIDNPPHIIASMSPYDDEALDRYRSVDGGVAALLLDYFADGIAALEALPSESARIEALAELVRECAAYNANVGAYPQDVDFVRYFLTESGEGRCVHFATTATLLYRSLGYPARFVSRVFRSRRKDDHPRTRLRRPRVDGNLDRRPRVDSGGRHAGRIPRRGLRRRFPDRKRADERRRRKRRFVGRLLFEFSRKRYEYICVERFVRRIRTDVRRKRRVPNRRPSFRSLPRRKPAFGSSC